MYNLQWGKKIKFFAPRTLGDRYDLLLLTTNFARSEVNEPELNEFTIPPEIPESQPKFLGQDMTELWNFRCNFNIRSAYQGFLHETATSYWGLLSFLASGDSGTPWSTGRGSSCTTMNSSPALEGWSWSSATSTSIPSQNDSSRLALHCISNLTMYKVPWMLESTGM